MFDGLFDGIPPGIAGAIGFVSAGGWILAGYFARLVYTGRLVPRTTMEDATHDRDEWRTESRLKDAQIAEKDRQLGHLAEVGRTVDDALRSLKAAAEQSQHSQNRLPGGEPMEAP